MRKRTLLLSIIAAGIAGAAAFGWVTIRSGFSARDNASPMETYVAKTARRLPLVERRTCAETDLSGTWFLPLFRARLAAGGETTGVKGFNVQFSRRLAVTHHASKAAALRTCGSSQEEEGSGSAPGVFMIFAQV